MKPFKYGVMDDVSLREERKGKSAVLTFGRFNPPTSGHELLINKVIQEAKKRRADNFIFASHSQDKRKNPLDSKTKTNYMKTFFKKAKIMYNPAVRTIFEALALLADKGYKNITVVVGGDRTEEFERTVRPYVNHPDPNKSLNLDTFEVVSAGRRDPDATDVSGMSASKMRAAATEGDFDSFKKGVPSSATDAQAKKLFNDLRKSMGIREEINEEKREFVKGWVNPRTKKIIAWRHHTPYHATHIYENLSKYGLTVDDLIDHHIAVLSKRNPKYKPEREDLEKRFEKIGYNDMLADRDETIEYPAIKKGWVAFVLQETKYGKMMTLRGITKDIKKSGIMVLEKFKTFKDLDRILITNYKNTKFAEYTGKTKNEDERYTSNSEAMQFLFGRRPKRREPKTEIGRTMAMFREEQELDEVNIPGYKGWVNPKTGKTQIIQGHSPYHVTMIANNPRFYGLTEKLILNHLIETYKERDSLIPEEDAEFAMQRLKSGERDMDYGVELLAMEKGWVRFVEGEYAEISGRKRFNDRELRKILQLIDKETPLTMKSKTTMGLQQYRPVGKTDVKVELYDNLEMNEIKNLIKGRRRGDKQTEIGRTMAMFREFCEAVKTRIDTDQEVLVVQDEDGNPNIFKDLESAKKKAESINGKVIKGTKGEIMVQVLIDPSLRKHLEEAKRIPKTRKNQDPDTHSDLYTDEDPKGTIHGLGFKDVKTAEASVRKIKASDRTHAHKIQAAIAMEQRAKVMKKTAEAAVYRKYIEQMKKKTKEMQEERKAPRDKGSGLPKKYVSGLSDKEAKQKAKEIEKRMKLPKDHPDAYKPVDDVEDPSIIDKKKSQQKSKATKKFQKAFGESFIQFIEEKKIKGIENKSKKTGVPYGILKKVYDRGMAAWRTGHRPGIAQQQWAYARINSFLTGGKTQKTTDKDLWAKVPEGVKSGIKAKLKEEAYLPGQATTKHGGKSGRGGKPGPRMTRQRKNRAAVLDHLILNGIRVLNQPADVRQKGSSDTFVVAKKDLKRATDIVDDYFSKPYVKIHMRKNQLRRENYKIIAEDVNEDSWKDKNDEREHNKLFIKSMKVMPRSPQQKKIIQQMNALRKKNGLELLKEERKATKPIKVLVFSGYSEENDNNMMKTAKRLSDECKKRGIKCFVAFVPFSRSFKNDDGTRTVVNKDGKEFIANRFDTVVVVRGAAGQKSGTLDMISMFEKDGFFVINSRDSIEICSDKYRTAVTLTEAGLPTPRTALVTDIKMIDDVHKQVGGKFPVVAKTLRGSKGKGVFILDSKESFKSVLDAVQKIDEEEEIILQEYIDMKNDMRIIVLDGKIMGVMQRDKVKGDFRSNFSLGGSVKEIKISNEVKELALQSAKAVGCYYCGVDVAISKRTKKPYILEINSSPGSEGFEIATKDNLVGDFVDYISDKENWMYSPTVVGRREMVTVEGIGPIVGKFDTGNMVVNSIHADKYEIDGDVVKWTHNGKRFTNKVIDTITVLQGAIAHNEEKRPMIELDIEFMGKKYPKRRFTIDDRSQKGTPLLMGVPFMKEFGLIVDPGKTFIKTQSLEEATLTKKEMKLRDKYAKDLKKKSSSFKSRYGKDYKDVIFGTATNMAKKKSEEEYTQNREGTKELTMKYKKMTPGQMNEIASSYFSRK